MNLMGVDLDGLGNHNFDRGSAYLRETLIPRADFKFVSANVIDPATGKPPAEWSKSRNFHPRRDQGRDHRLHQRGRPDPGLPELVDPFIVTNATDAVNKRAAQLDKSEDRRRSWRWATSVPPTARSVEPDGARPWTSPTTSPRSMWSSPTTPTSRTISRRDNGVLLVENRSKGLRFTRVSIVVDPATGQPGLHER